MTGFGIPGPDGNLSETSGHGLPEVDPEVLALLPEECRKALLYAKEQEDEWKNQWGTESESCMRGEMKIAFTGFPL